MSINMDNLDYATFNIAIVVLIGAILLAITIWQDQREKDRKLRTMELERKQKSALK